MRATWKGSISFGLVNIPIAVYPATREERVAFKQLRKKDLSPIRYKKVAEADEKEVSADEIVKGFEYEKGKWVVLEEKDFEESDLLSDGFRQYCRSIMRSISTRENPVNRRYSA